MAAEDLLGTLTPPPVSLQRERMEHDSVRFFSQRRSSEYVGQLVQATNNFKYTNVFQAKFIKSTSLFSSRMHLQGDLFSPFNSDLKFKKRKIEEPWYY